MFKKVFVRSAAALALSLLFVSPSWAQSILVIDTAKIVRESTVGKYMNTRLKSIGTTMQAEFEAKKKPVESEMTSIGSVLKTKKTQQEILQDQSLTKRIVENKQKQAVVQNDLINKNAELQILQKKATAEIVQKIDEIAIRIAKQRNASIVLDKSAVIYGASTIDITADVTTKLNVEKPSIAINRLPKTANKP